MATLTAATVLAALAAALWYITPQYSKKEPQPVPHVIPVIGHAFNVSGMRRNPFMKKISKERNGEPFSLLVAGRKHYIFHKPGEYSAVFRHGKVLDNGVFVRLILSNWFGESAGAAQAMTGKFRSQIHDLHTETLLRTEGNAPTAITYYQELDKTIQELDAELRSSEGKHLIKNALDFVVVNQGHPSTDAYFGKQLRESYPEVMEDLCIFNKEGFWPLLFGAPRWMYPRPHAARDRMLASCVKLAETSRSKGPIASPVIEGRIRIGDKFDADTGPREAFSVLFGLNSNSIPNAYCALLHIIEDPKLVNTLREELVSVGYPQMKPAEHVALFPEATPRLRSFLQESMRFHTFSSTIRELMEDMVLTVDGKEWELKKGGIINLSGMLLGLDAATHPNPEKFDAERFLATSLGGRGEAFSKTVKPFGGGSGYCPGRVFAEKQIMAFLAALITRYDMEIITPGYEIPLSSEFERVLSEPQVDIKIKLRA